MSSFKLHDDGLNEKLISYSFEAFEFTGYSRQRLIIENTPPSRKIG